MLKHVNHTLEGFDDSDGDEKDLKEYGGFLFEDLKHWVGKLTDFKRKVQRVQYQKAKTRNKNGQSYRMPPRTREDQECRTG